MKHILLLIGLTPGLVIVTPAVHASTLISAAWDTPLVFPQGDSEPIVKSGRSPHTTSK